MYVAIGDCADVHVYVYVDVYVLPTPPA